MCLLFLRRHYSVSNRALIRQRKEKSPGAQGSARSGLRLPIALASAINSGALVDRGPARAERREPWGYADQGSQFDRPILGGTGRAAANAVCSVLATLVESHCQGRARRATR